MHLACSLIYMDSPYKACSNQAHCTGTPLRHSLDGKFCHKNTSSFSCRKFFFMGFDLLFQKLGLLSLPLPPFCSTWIASAFICMRERQRNAHPPFSPFCTIFFFFSVWPGTQKMHSGYIIITHAWQFNVPLLLSKMEIGWKQAAKYTDLYKSPQARVCPHLETASPHKKSYVINWQVLTVSNSWSCYSRATNFIFIWCIEKIIYCTSGCTNTVTWHPSAFKA